MAKTTTTKTVKTAPTKTTTAKTAVAVAKVATKAAVATTTAAAPKKDAMDFVTGDYVVYPTHGVGTVDGIETATIGGMQVSMYKISFKQDRMVLRVPVQTARAKGLRKLASGDRLAEAMNTLKGRAKVKRTMWSRRAQEYESKINSGDPVAIAEVLRDLKRSNDDTEQSFSERQIYQSALSRLAREVAAVEKVTELDAATKLEGLMGKIKKAAANDQAVAA